jgi:formylglycine-generating enzyme required for sulfatase activity
MTNGKIFISYRRADSSGYAGRLFDHLSMRFGNENVFMDVEQLDPGVNFVEAINKAVSECDVLVALIGPRWLEAKDENKKQRLDNPLDFVRLEIAAALERQVLVIPILIDNAGSPSKDQLPANLQPLAQLNSFEIRHERFNVDVDCLVRAIETYHQSGKVKYNWQQTTTTLNTLPRGINYLVGSVGLILILVLFYWGGNVLLPYLRDNPSPKPPIGQLPPQTNTPHPKTATAKPSPTITSTPALKKLPTLITDNQGVPMALVPAGFFEMGIDADDAWKECQKFSDPCTRGTFDREEPVHTVTLDDFYIDQYEVTNNGYAECVDVGVCDHPSDTSSDTRDSYYGNAEYADYPVIYVDWDAAQTYCQWRGARLPTEAEWEKAARGGLDGAMYPWGNGFDETLANFCDINCKSNQANTDFDDGYEDTAPVGMYSPNDYELYDMAGNVYEWVADWYDGNYYTKAQESNPTGPEDGEYRVIRGGSWGSTIDSLRVAYRGDFFIPKDTHSLIGFRCASSP